MSEGLFLVGVSIAVGWLVILASSRFIAGFVYDVDPANPATFLAVGAVLVGVMLTTTYVPARPAGRSDPLTTLRAD